MFGDDRELLLVIHVITYLSSPGLEWFILYRNHTEIKKRSFLTYHSPSPLPRF